ncbi:MAG TPA: VWA domain-containing protein [Thermoanaerobaculia bacterium]|nr:VWA domain-containing protein [Thermoanaerobaculia bacterium]
MLAALVLLSSVLAQTAFQEKVTVSYVEVPVNVVGRDGAPVRGLTQANFEVYEDGAKRAIESFDAIDFASHESLKAISPLNPASRRNFLILFDLTFSNPTSIGRAQEAARDFIARNVGTRDLVAVGVVDVDRGFRFLTAFTTDRSLLTAAIADPATFRSVDPLQISGTNPIQITQDSSTPQGDTGERRSMASDLFADAARALNKMDDSYMRTRVRKQVESLGHIAHTLQKLAGRKHVVLLSEGFDPRLVQGRSAAETKEQAEENMAIDSGEVWKVDSDKRFGNAGTQMSIKLMADEFRRADVVLHAVDIKGLRVQNDVQGGARVNSNEGLFLLANPTGGTVFRNSNDLTSDFERLTRQQEVVYVLGFRAPSGKPGALHDLKVKLINVPGARALHRNGYYDSGEESSVERALTTAEVIINDIPQTDVDVASLAVPFADQVPVLLEIRGDDLVKSAQKNVATTDIFVYAFDEDGKVRDSLYQRVVLDMTKVGERLRGRGIRFYGTLRLDPGAYAVKSLVRVAESDKRGYQRVDIKVPDAREVSATPPLFFAGADGDDWVMVKASRDSSKTRYPFVVNGESFIPAARATSKGLFAVFVFNATPDELAWDVVPAAKLMSQTASDAGTKLVFAREGGEGEVKVTVRKK